MFVCRKGAVLAAALAAFLLFFACASLSAAGETSAQRALYTIVLDAGHGGKDQGTSYQEMRATAARILGCSARFRT